MKDASKHMSAILRRVKENGYVLMLDFDGVLSPIVKIPSNARVSLVARRALAACVKKMPVAILTGRTLADIEKRVALKDVIYAGSHGLEWKMLGRAHRRNLSRNTLSEFAKARRALLKYSKLFPSLFVEDKKDCLALGYRSLSKKQVIRFRHGASRIMNGVAQAGTIRVVDNLYTFEIMPGFEWTKGECARHIFKTVSKKRSVAVYIGDTLTDEDAFRVFTKGGVTIRVGKDSASVAQYYFKSRSGVDRFLRRMAHA